MKSCLAFGASIFALCLSVRAATYSGNGKNGFGGPIGQGSLTLTDDGTTISGTLTRGGGNFNDALVLYVDSVPGGFSDTSGFNDGGDGLRRAPRRRAAVLRRAESVALVGRWSRIRVVGSVVVRFQARAAAARALPARTGATPPAWCTAKTPALRSLGSSVFAWQTR